ncbi:MAG: transposase [Spartobacteria bacterium]|nr:transposase [Spartobacteria bacterium]
MTIARREIIDYGESGTYHCISRCVRRAFLCGIDKWSGRSYEYRRNWVRDRVKAMSETFAMDVLAFSVMSNHFHLVLRNDVDREKGWTDGEVVRRWLSVYPKHHMRPDGTYVYETRPEDVVCVLEEEGRVDVLRERLSDISWFMRSINEFIARKANREDECKGHFWEGRFKCQRLLDESAVLTCMAYVDLNPVRAKMAESLEDSVCTSVHERIEAEKAKMRVFFAGATRDLHGDECKKGNLATKRHIIHEKGSIITTESTEDESKRADWLVPIDNALFFEYKLTIDEYLELVDLTGRRLAAGKRGQIDEQLLPILQSLQIDADNWLHTVEQYGRLFYRVSGRLENIAASAKKAGRKWFCGLSASIGAFRPVESTA